MDLDRDGEDEYYRALRNGDVRVVQAFLDRGVNVNKTLSGDKTALSLASSHGSVEVVRVLLSHGADVNAVSEGSLFGWWNALFAAVKGGSVEVVHVLLNHGANVNAVSTGVFLMPDRHETVLFAAVEEGNVEVVRVLLSHGANVNAINDPDFYGRRETALFAAVEEGNVEVVRVLLSHGANVNAVNDLDFYGRHETALFAAAGREGNVEVVHVLLSHCSDVNAVSAALFAAVRHGNMEIVQALITNGANVNATNGSGHTALFTSAERGDIQVVEALLAHGTDVNITNADGRTALFGAAENGKVEVVKVLLRHVKMCHMNVTDQQGQTPLVAAVTSGNLEIVQALLNYGVNVNITGEKGWTALFYAVKNGNLKLIKVLLEHGANPSVVDDTGSSVLHYTANNFKYYLLRGKPVLMIIEIIKLLLNHGASADTRNSTGETLLLHYLSCSRTQRFERNSVYAMAMVCRFLIRRRVDINVRSGSGYSVIHLVLLLLRDVLHYDFFPFAQISNQNVVLTSKVQVAEVLLKLICSIFSVPVCSKSMASSRDDVDGNTPLHLWASLPHPREKCASGDNMESYESVLSDMVTQLLSHGAQINAPNGKGETPLHMAQTWTAAKFLLDRGASSNATDSNGNTSLLAQVKDSNGRRGMIFGEIYYKYKEGAGTELELQWKQLLNAGMDPWIANNEGATVLSSMLKSFFSISHIQAFLKATGAPYGQKFPVDSNGDTPLHTICKSACTFRRSHSEIWPLLTNTLVRSVSQLVNFTNRKGETALHIVCQLSSYVLPVSEIIQRLRAYGALADIADAKGKTCFDIAEAKPELMELLTNEIQLFKVDPCISWLPISVSHNRKLAQVAGGQNARRTRSLHYHSEPIGSGGFGQVYAGIESKDGREVAVKRVERERMSQPEDRREIKHLVKLADCENVVRYLSYHEDQHFLYIILELMEGTVEELLDARPVQEEELQSLCKDVLGGLNYLHKNNVIHRDIKSSNILYKHNPKLCLKLSDFGLSGRAQMTGSKQSTTVMHSKAGTRCWMAPELLKGTMQHSEASDMFACGLVLHYILSSRKHPFGPTNLAGASMIVVENKTVENILNDKLVIDVSLSPEATDLMKLMVNHDKDKRPSAAEALKHPLVWSSKQKTDFLCAVGNQPEVESPRHLAHPLSPMEQDLENTLGPQFITNPWDGKVPQIYAEMTKSRRSRKYTTSSAVDLLRFVRNTLAHVDELPTSALKESVLTDFVFLSQFPTLVMDVYKAVESHGWYGREEIAAALPAI